MNCSISLYLWNTSHPFVSIMYRKIFSLAFFVLLYITVLGQNTEEVVIPDLEKSEKMIHFNVISESVEKSGKTGLKVIRSEKGLEDETMLIVPDILFKDGIIEFELTGEPLSEADPNMRGFVGLAFRIDPKNYYNYECIYLRPTNGRAQEQARRNHSTQYISHPEFPWYRLREEFPGVYESYVDLLPGRWTKMKVEIAGISAKLYIDGSEQPCLVINDLKKGDREGLIGLWLHATTLAHFADLKITIHND